MFPMEATVDPPSPGSRLDADHPENGVLIPCRFTLSQRRVVEVGHDFDPFPALGAQRFGFNGELLHGEPVEQHRVGQVAFVFLVE